MRRRDEISSACHTGTASTFACSSVAFPQGHVVALNAQEFFEQERSQQPKEDPKKRERERRQALRAESRAQQMLRDIIGYEQWQVYRRTNRVVVFGKHSWLIGNVFGGYRKKIPLSSKPDVVRIDGKSRVIKAISNRYMVTSFCIVSPLSTREQLPYTDKVLAYAMHCLSDEKGFYKTGNRVSEHAWKKIPECAVFERKG